MLSAVRFAAVLSLFVVSGCVLEIEIAAGFDDQGRLEFRSEQQGKDHWCLDRLKIVDRETREVMWEIEGGSGGTSCEDDFPLLYGEAPDWMVEKTDARPLRNGSTYDIIGWSGNSLSGVFRYDVKRVVTNTDEEPIWD